MLSQKKSVTFHVNCLLVAQSQHSSCDYRTNMKGTLNSTQPISRIDTSGTSKINIEWMGKEKCQRPIRNILSLNNNKGENPYQ